ncbi:MAG: hypothetical protein IJ514_03820 [Clostridia bacterium]|nr:hypothetical protein [Clostridia bacterium]
MKRLFCLLTALCLAATFSACSVASTSEPSTEPGSSASSGLEGDNESGEGGGEQEEIKKFEDYYEISAGEGFALKTVTDGNGVYEKCEAETLGKAGVYEFSCTGWKGELQVAETALSTHNEKAPCETAPQVREYLQERGYKYAAFDIALDAGASIGVYTYLPMRANMTSELGGLSLKDGAVLSGVGNFLEEFEDRVQVFKDGYRIRQGIEIEAGAWYTVVVELQLDSEQSLQGLDSWVNVSLTNGNGGKVYVAGGRFYTNATFAEDYGANGERAPEPLQDYYEFGADEMIDIKGVDDCYVATDGEVYGRSDTYTHVGNGWNTEVSVKETAFVADSVVYHKTAQEARASCIAKGYKYAAITFALGEGASISVTNIIPTTGTNTSNIGGLNFADGAALAYRASVDTDGEKAFYKVYANGEEVAIGDAVSSGVWYTVVVKILIDTSENTTGAGTWLNVSFGATGNNKPVYVAGVRYYTNETFAEDYGA